jgi:hypothetical protein
MLAVVEDCGSLEILIVGAEQLNAWREVASAPRYWPLTGWLACIGSATASNAESSAPRSRASVLATVSACSLAGEPSYPTPIVSSEGGRLA